MVMRYCWAVVLPVAMGVIAGVAAGADEIDAIRTMIGEIKVRLEHTQEVQKSDDGARPPLQRDAWTFVAGGVNPTVRYARYLNRPPDFSGDHPSLTNSDMGIGLDGGPFGHWYRGSAIRLVLNETDVFASRAATRTETQEGPDGHLRLVWELDEGRMVTLDFTVPRDGRAVFARLELAPGKVPVHQIEIKLTCYPGGFGPAYGHPSHRYAKTASAAAEVPPDFAVTAEHPFPVLPLLQGQDWVFYGDKRVGSGGLGLLTNSAEHPAGRVNLSNYGVATSLTYPPDTRRLHLGFYAYSIENGSAERALVDALEGERTALTTIPFWTEAE